MADSDVSKHTTKELFTALTKEPDHEDLREQLKSRILERDPAINNAAHHHWSVVTPFPSICSWFKSVLYDIGRWLGVSLTWTNCIHQQLSKPSEIRYPKSLQDLIDAVKHAQDKKKSIRAVGSGHSFSNIAPPYDGGILLDPRRMNKLLEVKTDSLRDSTKANILFAVESGITIKKLNDELHAKKLALLNMGAYDGQTLAGAISTGTHGTGIELGPIASSVRALILVSEDGTVYQIEPSNGISDPAKFEASNPLIVLKQDDDWFYSTVIAIGSMGLIYSYILEVTPWYFLRENRYLTTWEKVKETELVFPSGEGIPAVLKNNRHYEVDINPYTVKGNHSCIVQKKNIDIGPKQGSRGFADWITSLIAGWPTAEKWLVWALNTFPWISPETINSALSSLVDTNYVDQSYKVLNIGAVDNVQALAMEISFPVDETLLNSVDNLLKTFAKETSKGWYLAGPVALRFVKASPAYLAPQQGRTTCMVELDMLVGIETGERLLKAVVKEVHKENPKARVHWGLDLDTVTGEEARQRYEEYPKWLGVYHTLNSTGVFDSPFTDRLGISMGKNDQT
jgi:L-gulono-1,4-lactone dehydrogenase